MTESEKRARAMASVYRWRAKYPERYAESKRATYRRRRIQQIALTRLWQNGNPEKMAVYRRRSYGRLSPEVKAQYAERAARARVQEISDKYICCLLKSQMRRNAAEIEFPAKLIELKRWNLKIKRLIKERKNEKHQ